MKINIHVDDGFDDMEVQINCPELTPDIEKIISMIRMMDMKIAVKKDDETVMMDMSDVFYVESIDRVTFLYTENQIFESDMKLYELDNILCTRGFFKASKSCLINLKRIKSLKADINRRIRVTMENGEQIVVSRMYADELRKRLGIK
ncbi:MAG: LytTR family transcriptional regulator DNA-binding domain-containing protein [Lachnospiraceae bacterium]|nr:LytTR family transcriptional regulator DNA-binding domain-containing protein [Lachnospiraceae bacterium]